MKRTLPSLKPTLQPPGWKLLAFSKCPFERVMTRSFGSVKVYAWRTKGAPSHAATDAFLATVRAALNPTGAGTH